MFQSTKGNVLKFCDFYKHFTVEELNSFCSGDSLNFPHYGKCSAIGCISILPGPQLLLGSINRSPV